MAQTPSRRQPSASALPAPGRGSRRPARRFLRRLATGLALACALMVGQWCLNAARFKILVNSLDNRVGFVTSLKAFMANVFISAITPSQTGGGPVQIYILSRAGVPVARGFKLDHAAAVQASVAEAEASLNGSGRIVLRASGTEPLIRVMVEGRDAAQVRHTAETIADAVRIAAAAG